MSFDPATITLMRAVLDDAWTGLLPYQQAETSRAVLAERILKAAAKGERDPVRLRACALIGIASPMKEAS
jgi:hypothetical protein